MPRDILTPLMPIMDHNGSVMGGDYRLPVQSYQINVILSATKRGGAAGSGSRDDSSNKSQT